MNQKGHLSATLFASVTSLGMMSGRIGSEGCEVANRRS